MRRKHAAAFFARDQWQRVPWIVTWLAICALMTLQGSAVSLGADDDAAANDPLADLKARIEQLERDNRELRSALTKRSDDSLFPMISDADLAALPPAPDESADTEPAQNGRLESLVDGMIRRMNAQAKSISDAQEARINALDHKLEAVLKKNPRGANGVFGNTGLLFTSNDGNFKTHIGGTAQLDFVAPESTASSINNSSFSVAGTNFTQDAVFFRRLRVRADGTMYGWIDWASEFDFAMALQNTATFNGGSASVSPDPFNGLRNTTVNGGSGLQGGNTMNIIAPTTVFMTFKDVLPNQNIRVGNQQDWFSLEHCTSARYLDFMERAQIMDVFSGPQNNGYCPGVSFFGTDACKRVGWAVGVYKNNAYDAGYPFSIGNAWEYGGRVYAVPYYDEASQGRYLVHTGFGAEYRQFNTNLSANMSGDNVRVRSRGDLRISNVAITPNFADSGNFFAQGQALIDPEIAVVWGPWTLQAEYTAGWFNGARNVQGGTQLGGTFMSGGYAEALYFLTGENKNYSRETGLFLQTIPKNNVNFSQGQYGAWQVGTRYEWLDMNSGLMTGGRNQTITWGLNWWINPNIRYQFNVAGTYINNAVPVASTNGSLAGTQFTGEGLIMMLGTRMDISY